MAVEDMAERPVGTRYRQVACVVLSYIKRHDLHNSTCCHLPQTGIQFWIALKQEETVICNQLGMHSPIIRCKHWSEGYGRS